MNKMELETHECLQFWLPQIAVALQNIAKAAKFYMEENKTAKEIDKELRRVKNLTLEEALKELRGEN
jgi:hypothetical protein